jgi:hypothetical protein
MAVTWPATSSVPVQTVAYSGLVQPPAPALSAQGKPADDPGRMAPMIPARNMLPMGARQGPGPHH